MMQLGVGRGSLPMPWFLTVWGVGGLGGGGGRFAVEWEPPSLCKRERLPALAGASGTPGYAPLLQDSAEDEELEALRQAPNVQCHTPLHAQTPISLCSPRSRQGGTDLKGPKPPQQPQDPNEGSLGPVDLDPELNRARSSVSIGTEPAFMSPADHNRQSQEEPSLGASQTPDRPLESEGELVEALTPCSEEEVCFGRTGSWARAVCKDLRAKSKCLNR